jgi:hypothetical protein
MLARVQDVTNPTVVAGREDQTSSADSGSAMDSADHTARPTGLGQAIQTI